MVAQWKIDIINNYKQEITNGKKLTFIHIPKCAGSFASQYMKLLNIPNKGHKLVESIPETDAIYFGIIRDPVDRFESLLNFALNLRRPPFRFPARLCTTYFDKSIQLNDFLNQMTDAEIADIKLYLTLTCWTKNIDLIITVDELEETLTLLGNVMPEDFAGFANKNVSKKDRGVLSDENRARIANIYSEDVQLFKNLTRID